MTVAIVIIIEAYCSMMAWRSQQPGNQWRNDQPNGVL